MSSKWQRQKFNLSKTDLNANATVSCIMQQVHSGSLFKKHYIYIYISPQKDVAFGALEYWHIIDGRTARSISVASSSLRMTMVRVGANDGVVVPRKCLEIEGEIGGESSSGRGHCLTMYHVLVTKQTAAILDVLHNQKKRRERAHEKNTRLRHPVVL